MTPAEPDAPHHPRRATGNTDAAEGAPHDAAPGDGPPTADGGAPPPDPSTGITPGMAMVRQAVTFTNAQVLDPTASLSGKIQLTGMDVGANALADSAAAMMLQDMRSYLQSTEMVLVPVTAAAFAAILADDPAGEKALSGIDKMLGYLTAFSSKVITNAATIEKDFG